MGKQILRTTLVFLFKECNILLGLKKRGFGRGKWNGFGGKIQTGETTTRAACRELKEECAIDVRERDLEQFALLQFEFEGESTNIEVNVYKTALFEGKETETEEMKPQWFDVSNIPFPQMWVDDKIWFPYMFSGKTFYAKFLFRGHDEIIDYKIHEVPLSDFENLRYSDDTSS